MEDLVWNVKLDCEDLKKELANTATIRCGSDGGADDGKASFGWTFQGETGTWLLSGIGVCDGPNPSSYRSECMGVLSSLCVWDCLRKAGYLTDEHSLSIVCDNRGTVSVVQKIFGWKNFFIGRDASEADLLHCIQSLARDHFGSFDIKWIESHQDEKRVESLSEEAILNIEADRLASQALSQAVRCPIVKLREPAGCDLILNEMSITGQRNRAVKAAIDREPLKQLIMRRCGWTEEKFNSILWDALGKSLAKLPNSHQVTVVKHCNDILPMGKTLLRRDATENAGCEACGCDMESFDHLLVCAGLHEWRSQSPSRLRKALHSCGTGRGVTNVLIKILYGSDEVIPDHLADIHTKCVEVGCFELWRGRLPRALAERQHALLAKNTSTRTLGKEGLIWATKTVSAILDEFLSLWWHRNKIRHDGAEGDDKNRRRQRAESKCRAVTHRIARLRPSDRTLFTDEETVLKWNTGAIFSYLCRVEPLLKKCEADIRDRPRQDWDETDGEVIDPP